MRRPYARWSRLFASCVRVRQADRSGAARAMLVICNEFPYRDFQS